MPKVETVLTYGECTKYIIYKEKGEEYATIENIKVINDELDSAEVVFTDQTINGKELEELCANLFDTDVVRVVDSSFDNNGIIYIK